MDLTMDVTLWSYAGLQDLHNLIRAEERKWGADGAVETRDRWLNLIQDELYRRDAQRQA